MANVHLVVISTHTGHQLNVPPLGGAYTTFLFTGPKCDQPGLNDVTDEKFPRTRGAIGFRPKPPPASAPRLSASSGALVPISQTALP